MDQQKSAIFRILGVSALLITLILILGFVVQYFLPGAAEPAASQPYPGLTASTYPPPRDSISPDLSLTLTAEVAAELALIPTTVPLVTPIPTPIVTAVPLAAMPVIPPGECPPAEASTIFHRQGDLLMSITADGREPAALLDVQQELGKYLAGEEVGVNGSDSISISPDGSQIVLVVSSAPRSPASGEPPIELDLYLFDPRRGTLELIAQDAWAPEWSPDGSWLAYITGSDLLVLDMASGETRALYSGGAEDDHRLESLSWSPDGNGLVFVDGIFRQMNQIVGVDTRTGEVLFEVEHPGHFAYTPRWSPGGDSILYVTTAGVASGSGSFFNLWVIDSAGGGGRQITKDMTVQPGAAWSPGGRWIALSGLKGYEKVDGDYDLWVVDSASSGSGRLTATAGTNETTPTWAADCSGLYYLSGDSGLRRISLVDGTQEDVAVAAEDYVIFP